MRLHVSAFWKPVYTKSPISTGSLGVGIVLSPGPSCREGRTWPPVEPALKLGGGLECRLPVPVGKGFATSASVALCTALKKYSFWEAVARAHVAEVISKTGLGDVMAIAFGRGLAVRIKPGGPGWGKVISLKVPPVGLIAATVESPFKDTPSMLQRLDVENEFDKAWKVFMEEKSFSSFLKAAIMFSREVGFMNDEVEEILKLEGVLGGYVKKSALIVFTKPEYESKVRNEVKKRGFETFKLRVFQ